MNDHSGEWKCPKCGHQEQKTSSELIDDLKRAFFFEGGIQFIIGGLIGMEIVVIILSIARGEMI